MQFEPFPKVPRFSKPVVVTEKIDGTNASVLIDHAELVPDAAEMAIAQNGELVMFAGSRKRWITPKSDNFGFAQWCVENAEQLFELGVGHHFGEWWGRGVQRGYELGEKRFSLFNVNKWEEFRPECCHVVPVLWRGQMDDLNVNTIMRDLKEHGSYAAPGFKNPEGVMVYHQGSNSIWKKTFDFDGGKWQDC